jgi:hypothetical protein
MRGTHTDELRTKRFDQRSRNNRHPILRALAIAHHKSLSIQVQILRTQMQCLQQAQATAVEKPRHQRVLATQLREYPPNLRTREHNRQVLRASRADDVVDPGKVDAEHLAIKKEKCGQCLRLRSGCHIAVLGQMRQVLRNLGTTHVAGVTLAVEDYVTPDPADVLLLGAITVMPDADGGTHFIQQPRFSGRAA